MFLFSFNKFAWFDRVFIIEEKIKSTKPDKAGSWDIVKIQDDYFLCLWDTISFQELYTHKLKSIWEPAIVTKWLLSTKTMELLHWMVYERYSTYKAVVKLFVSFEIEKLIGKQTSKINNKATQELMIFPDLRTLYNTIDQSVIQDKKTAVLSSIQTQVQKDKLFRKIKSWEAEKIIWTSSEIFQDYSNLTKITFISPHKRYYTSQQDPRYKTSMVVDKIKEIYWCELIIVN